MTQERRRPARHSGWGLAAIRPEPVALGPVSHTTEKVVSETRLTPAPETRARNNFLAMVNVETVVRANLVKEAGGSVEPAKKLKNGWTGH